MWRSLFVAVWLIASVEAAVVHKVEPPGWWAGHSINPVRVMLTGEGLKTGAATSSLAGLRPGPVKATPDGRYAFLNLTIAPSVKPGTYKLTLGGSAFEFEVYERLPLAGRFQGFDSNDVIYLLMPDRFANGDPSNDGTLHDRKNPRLYHGGDLQGIIDRLPYLKDLGVTAIWMTPVYDNTNEARSTRRGETSSYHGYGATDPYAVEEHFGSMTKLRELVDAAHKLGLKVIQDQVANHVGAEHRWATQPPTPTWLNGTVEQHLESSSKMWTLFDPHSTPEIRRRTLEGWFGNRLPDLNQNDPEVARYLIQNTLWWIGRTGIDGIRQDTVPYVPKHFWQKWTAAIKREYPRFTSVGEVYFEDPVVVAHFNDTGLQSVFDFPLYFTIREVFTKGEDLKDLGQALSHDKLFPNPDRFVTFIGLHDVRRFRQEGPAEALKNAFTFLLTARGIPMIYYGDEIAMQGGGDPDNRRDMPGGWKEDTRNVFDGSGRTAEENDVFQHVRKLLHLRRDTPALRRGKLTTLHAEDKSFVYLRGTPAGGVLVAFGEPAEIDIDTLRFPTGDFRDALGGAGVLSVREKKLRVTGPGVFMLGLATPARSE